MAVQRSPKSKRRPYVQVDREPAQTPVLSLKAKGLLLYMLSTPDDWQHSEADMVAHCADGRTAVRAALAELEQAGHVVKDKRRVAGKWSVEYRVIEAPSLILVLCEKPRRKTRHGERRKKRSNWPMIEKYDCCGNALIAEWEMEKMDRERGE